MSPDPLLRAMWLHAWVGGLGRSLPAGPPADPVRLDDTGRAPIVRLRAAGPVR
jgi:hypothetical protein